MDNGEGGECIEAEISSVGVDGFGKLFGTGFRIQGAESFEELTVHGLMVLHVLGVRGEFKEDDEGGGGLRFVGLV